MIRNLPYHFLESEDSIDTRAYALRIAIHFTNDVEFDGIVEQVVDDVRYINVKGIFSEDVTHDKPMSITHRFVAESDQEQFYRVKYVGPGGTDGKGSTGSHDKT